MRRMQRLLMTGSSSDEFNIEVVVHDLTPEKRRNFDRIKRENNGDPKR